MKPDADPTRSLPAENANHTRSFVPELTGPQTQEFEPALDAGLAAAFGSDPTPGGWSRPPLLRDDPSDHTPLVQPTSTEMPRGNTDRYQLLGEIARGGMGVIIKGRDPDLGRDLAFKVLKAELTGKPAAVQRFVEEAQVGGQLQHPGVVPVYDLGRFADGRPYFAMKLVKGQTLAELLTARPNPAADRGRFLQIFLQICQTVAYAHAKGVIHRDLKPSNIMVGAFGEVLVMDWGLAKVLPRGGVADEERASQPSQERPEDEPTLIHTARSGSGSDTAAGSVMGTPSFMPPEQAGGETEKLDERADVFGLGAVLCVVLTGYPPYLAETAEATRLMAIRGQQADALARLDACGADAELLAVCKQCLSPDRDARPRHAGEMAGTVGKYLAGVEQRAHRAEMERAAAEARAAEEANTRREADAKTAEERKRRRTQLALAAAVLVVMAGGVAFAWWQNHKDEEARLKQAEFEGEQKAQQAAFDTERKLKAEQAQERARNLLAIAVEARKEYRFDAAWTALREARELATNLAPQFVETVEQARADLAFVVELDAIRMKRSTWIADERGKGHFDEAGAPPAYRAAFTSRGLDVTVDPASVGQRVVASAVRDELVSAFDDWAILEKDEAVRDKVLAVLRSADADSGAAPFRDPAVWVDKVRLEALAAKVNVARLSPGAVVAIAEVMRLRGVDAAPLLRHAMSLHPREFFVAFSLGQVLSNKYQSFPEALGVYRAARALRPDNTTLLNNLGAVLEFSGDLPGAIAALREAIKLDPNFVPAHHDLGNALRDSGDLPGAIAAYQKALTLDPKYAYAHNGLGVALYESHDLPGAIAAYQKALTLDPKYAYAHYNLGIALADSGDLPGAIAAYQKALTLDPKYSQAHCNLGIALADSGDLPGAIAAYQKALTLDSKLLQGHFNLGNALKDTGDLPGAIAAYQKALTLDPKLAKAHTNLGLALQKSGDLPGAIAAYQKALTLDPKDAPAYTNLGVISLQQGKYPAAIASARAAIEADPKYSNARALLGDLLLRTGDIPGARASLTEAARLDKRWAGLLAKLPPVAVAPIPREVKR